MIKIFMTCRNRLEITKKSIAALYKNTNQPFQLYIYDNLSDYNILERFEFFGNLYKDGLIAQITFNTKESTFKAFSKSAALNSFGLMHNQDPQKHTYDFLTILDNDMIVTPDWDIKIKQAWQKIKNDKLNNVLVVTQYPGGTKFHKKEVFVGDMKASIGKLGGSGFWNIPTDFFDRVGFLNLSRYAIDDQDYWSLLSDASHEEPYIMAIHDIFCFHAGGGGIIGSTINQFRISSQFVNEEQKIKEMSFSKFYEFLNSNQQKYINW